MALVLFSLYFIPWLDVWLTLSGEDIKLTVSISLSGVAP